MRLSIHMNPIADLRRMGGDGAPDLAAGVAAVDMAGADGVSLRYGDGFDAITERDLALVKSMVLNHLDIMINANDDLIRKIMKLKPDQVTFMPSAAEGPGKGLDPSQLPGGFKEVVDTFHASGMEVSIFADPDIAVVKEFRNLGVDYITLNTASYAQARNNEMVINALESIESAALGANKLGMRVLAYGGIGHRNIGPLAAFDTIEEAILDQRFFSRAIFLGIDKALSEVRDSVRWQKLA